MSETAEQARGALSGWRVLEIADGLAASFCAKVLGDLGADVVKVEPPEGHASRRWAPRRVDAAPDEPGGRFLYLNGGKSSLVVGDGPGGLEDLRRLAAECDIVVTDRPDHLSLGESDETTIMVVDHPVRAHRSVREVSGTPSRVLPRRRRGVDPPQWSGLAIVSRAPTHPSG